MAHIEEPLAFTLRYLEKQNAFDSGEQLVAQVRDLWKGLELPDEKIDSLASWTYEVITKHSEVPSQLVRFRAMVQDQHESEYTLAACTVDEQQQLTLFRGNFEKLEDSALVQPMFVERFQYTAVAVPAMSGWTSSVTTDTPDAKSWLSSFSKCGIASAVSEGRAEVHKGAERIACSQTCVSKEREPAKVTDQITMCVLKLHSENSSNDGPLQLNRVYDFYGVVKTRPKCVGAVSTEQNLMVDERTMGESDLSHLPELHVLHCRHVPALHVPKEPIQQHQVAFDKFLDLTSSIFYGDRLCAELLLYALIAHVEYRRGGRPIGALSLNISGIAGDGAKDIVSALQELLSSIYPLVHKLPIDIQSLNASRWTPQRDHERALMKANALQLVDGTLLLCDETQMATGQLNDNGVRNIKALELIAANQNILYDFKFHTVPFHTDYPVVVLSESKSLIKCDIHVRATKMKEPYLTQQLSDEERRLLRDYLAECRTATVELTKEVSTEIEGACVQLRRDDKALTADDLHHRLTLAKLIAAAKGTRQVSLAHWEHALMIHKCIDDSLKK